mmetsp:Transcript_14175/g.32969  ORF Transcript_14175/g.32969 Transcript_14175/m.32969 type:complete len:106 (-) Transcript_14175:38-355(-)
MINSVLTSLIDVKPTTFASFGADSSTPELDLYGVDTESTSTGIDIMDAMSCKRRTPSGPSVSSPLNLTADILAKRWGIGRKQASDTLKVTTQKGVRNITSTLKTF